MTIMNVLSLFGGLGLFLFGMQLMGEALEKAAGTRLKKLLGMVTGNRFLAMLAGITITAVVQSSSATTVMVVGFVNAGLMSLTQAVGVIMGANIGTTVTSLLLSVQIDFAAIFTFLGLILSNLPDKYRTAKQFGTITMGLGILFIGMNTMSGAMEPLRTWEGFQTAMASINNPILGVLIGAGITAVLQSSAASIGILQTLVAQGLIGLNSAIFILFGQNIGTCVTALLACAGTNSTAKRAATVLQRHRHGDFRHHRLLPAAGKLGRDALPRQPQAANRHRPHSLQRHDDGAAAARRKLAGEAGMPADQGRRLDRRGNEAALL